MNAIRFHSFGGPEVLRWEEAPRPEPGPGEALLRLKAAALNHLDIWVRTGSRERNIPLPHIPGSDGAGVVASVGPGVRGFAEGDAVLISPGLSCGRCAYCLGGRDNLCSSYRVLGTLEDGTNAEYVKLPALNLLPIPDGMSFEEAAAIPLVFLTAWHMLSGLARVRPGETVLVHGASSGVGSAGIQIAKLLGARVVTTAGSAEKLASARSLGADVLIPYREKDFVAEIRELTGKRGVDVVFEHIGGEVLEKSLLVLGKGGRLVTCGATQNYLARLDMRYIYSRHQTLYGSFMGSKNELIEVLSFFVQNPTGHRLRPVIDRVYPIAEAAEAHRRLEARHHFGKIVLAL